MALTDITASEVLRAIEECDSLGREGFLHQYGFGEARRYLLSHNGRFYDSKAIVGVAHGYLPGQECLSPAGLSGGADHAVRLLRRLSFTVVDDPVKGASRTDALLDAIANLRVNRASGQPALYQPITLLWAIGRARRGESRLLPWPETEKPLQDLLNRHGLRGERPRPDYPISALYYAGLWELQDHSSAVPPARGDTALRRWYAENRPRGGLPEPEYDLLQRSGEARLASIDALLIRYFEGLDYRLLLTDVGLYDEGVADDVSDPGDTGIPQAVVVAAQYERLCRIVEHREDENQGRRTIRTLANPIRSGSARRAVLLRSEGRCENPACTGQPADVTDTGDPLLEIDHIEDLARGGRDHPSQMIALCANCHAIKTRGRTRETLRARLLDVARARHTLLVPPGNLRSQKAI
ncbi:HNH endonuclease signature motif containing protein [Streptomyces sp. NPDC051636]|uniref:HNH endonuclease signature motif containing protein n=1 Tax=Streptomyces sp. NPDC051636 TaxID=3365663 RepID=UPI0037B1F9F6